MNLLADSQAINFLINCEEQLNSTLDQGQLEEMCNELIESFYLYLEEIQNYKSEQILELKLKQAEIDTLNFQIQKQTNHLKDQQNNLNIQIDICQQLELQLQFLEEKSLKSENDILKEEAELRKKLHQQNRQYQYQIQEFISVQQQIDKQILQFSKEKGLIQLQFEQLQKKNEDQQFLIQNLAEQLAIIQNNPSIVTQIQQNTDCIRDSQYESIELKSQQNGSQNSHNQINFQWEKISPSISSIWNSISIINPTNTKCDTQSRCKIKSFVFLTNKQKQYDPYHEFFKLITQCVKLDLGQAHIYTMNFDHLFQKFINDSIPFNQWYKKIIEILS